MVDWNRRYSDIVKNMELDLTANIHGDFSKDDLSEIKKIAKQKLDAALEEKKPQSEDDLNKIWTEIATDFHSTRYWGFKKEQVNFAAPTTPEQPGLGRFIVMFLVPIIFTKTLVLYFGLKWSNYPDEGYGPIFVAVIILWLANFSYFLWKTRHYKD